MNIANRIKAFLFFSLLSASIIPQIVADSNVPVNFDDVTTISDMFPGITEEQLRMVQETLQDEMEQILKILLEQLNDLEVILQDLALDISNNCIKPKNKTGVIDNISNLRQLINDLRNDAFSQIDPTNLYILLSFNSAIIKHIRAAVDKNLKELPPFSLDQITTRRVDDIIDLEELTQDLQRNNNELNALKQKARNVGLFWYNKIYRTIDNYVIEPTSKYKLISRTAKTALAAAIPVYLLRYFDYKPVENLPFVGPRAKMKPSGVNPISGAVLYSTNDDDLKALGKLEKFIIDYRHGMLPLLGIGVPLVWASWRNELYAAKNWIGTKFSIIHNHLKGGIYHKKADELNDTTPTITFDDVQGDTGKRELSQIIKYILDPERFDRGECAPEKGYLLTGPSRTGKSYLAQAVAGEIKEALQRAGRKDDEFKFIEIPVNLINEKGIDYILRVAKTEAPCVLFIDEIDLLRLQRAGGNPAVLSQFLSSLSGTLDQDPKKQVIILATTNTPENMDKSLRQRGRFGKEIRFEKPGLNDRKEFIENQLRKLSLNVNLFNVEKLALEAENCTYEDISAVIKGAFRRAKIKGIVVNQKELEKSFDQEVRNIIVSNGKELPEEEKQLLAVHQAGRAYAHILLDAGLEVSKVTIRPITARLKEEAVWDSFYKDEKQLQKHIKYGEVFTYRLHDTLNILSRAKLINRCKLHLAGFVAEKVLLGSCGYTYRPEDKKEAYEITKSIVFKGIDPAQLSKQAKNRLLDEVYQLLTAYEQEMIKLFEENKDTLQTITQKLQDKQTLSRKQLETIINPDSNSQEAKNDDATISSQDIKRELDITEEKHTEPQ